MKGREIKKRKKWLRKTLLQLRWLCTRPNYAELEAMLKEREQHT